MLKIRNLYGVGAAAAAGVIAVGLSIGFRLQPDESVLRR